jgi:hypothetical protein
MRTSLRWSIRYCVPVDTADFGANVFADQAVTLRSAFENPHTAKSLRAVLKKQSIECRGSSLQVIHFTRGSR